MNGSSGLPPQRFQSATLGASPPRRSVQQPASQAARRALPARHASGGLAQGVGAIQSGVRASDVTPLHSASVGVSPCRQSPSAAPPRGGGWSCRPGRRGGRCPGLRTRRSAARSEECWTPPVDGRSASAGPACCAGEYGARPEEGRGSVSVWPPPTPALVRRAEAVVGRTAAGRGSCGRALPPASTVGGPGAGGCPGRGTALAVRAPAQATHRQTVRRRRVRRGGACGIGGVRREERIGLQRDCARRVGAAGRSRERTPLRRTGSRRAPPAG